MKIAPRKKAAIVFAATCLVLGGSFQELPAQPLGQSAAGTPAAEIEKLLKPFSRTTPGCAVGVEHGQDAPILRAAGSANLEQDVPIDMDTVFEAGSASKQFTAAAVLLLARAKMLSLDDDVRKYIPEIPAYGAPIRIRHLLNHTSGLRDWGNLQDIAGWPRGDKAYGLRDALRIMSRQKSLNYEPGTAYSYTNSGYNLLAIIVERVTGETLQSYSQENLFGPLGMTHTRWRDDFHAIVPHRAVAYARSGTSFVQRMPFENVVGNGGLLTTIGDLLLWNRALSEGRIGPGITQQMEEPGTLNDGRRIKYAVGLFVDQYHGFPEAYHEGLTAGYHAWLSRFPDQALSIAILCNSQNVDTYAMGHRIADLYLPARATDSGAILSDADKAAMEGLYVNKRSGLPLRIVRRDGALFINADGAMTPAANAPAARRDASGNVFAGRVSLQVLAGQKLRQAVVGDWAQLERAPAIAESRVHPKDVTGRYRGAEIDATFRISDTPSCMSMTIEERPSREECLRPIYKDAFLFRNTLIRLVRSPRGVVTALILSNDRVWDLRVNKIN